MSKKDYFKVLPEINILIIHYDRDRYYYRANGVIRNAGSADCYIIASDYPLTIKDTFTDFRESGKKFDIAIAFIKKYGQDNYWLWRKKRTGKSIANILFSAQE